MVEFIEKAKLKIRQRLESRKLHKQRDSELKALHQKKQFEIGKTELERQVEIEELKAKVRKEQAKSQPKGGQKTQGKKTSFAAFQEYCDDFANAKPAIGQLDFGGNDGKRTKKGNKGSKTGIGTGFF